jgi:hypothetical protein
LVGQDKVASYRCDRHDANDPDAVGDLTRLFPADGVGVRAAGGRATILKDRFERGD